MTALHVGMSLGNVRVVDAINQLIASFRAKGLEFERILKMGRTQLQDAVPMTLGQEFKAFGETLAGEVRALDLSLVSGPRRFALDSIDDDEGQSGVVGERRRSVDQGEQQDCRDE